MKQGLVASVLTLLVGGAGATAFSSSGLAMPFSAARYNGVEISQPSELLIQVQERRWRGRRGDAGGRYRPGWNRGQF